MANKKRKKQKILDKKQLNNGNGITLIALVITIIVRYDKIIKRCNIKSFLHFGYRLRWVKTHLFLKFW